MKHTFKITMILLIIFLLSQFVGLLTVNQSITPIKNETTGEITINYSNTVIGPPPEVEESEKLYYAIGILIAVLIGTGIIFLLRRFGLHLFFRYWFLLTIFLTLYIAFGVYINWAIAFFLAVILAIWRVFKPNPYIHNLTEVFIYAGVAVVLISFFNILSIFVLLILISIYDMIAVWQSKHMVKLAQFQLKAKLFAGLSIPYSFKIPKKTPKNAKKVKQKMAILGGGDMAFPLLFSSVSMQHFINLGLTKLNAFLYASVIVIFAALALAGLLLKGKKDRFYPAMPFITLGCFLGYLVVLLI